MHDKYGKKSVNGQYHQLEMKGSSLSFSWCEGVNLYQWHFFFNLDTDPHWESYYTNVCSEKDYNLV